MHVALAYSGVPNAGEPLLMSTLEVKLPYITGQPGAHQLHQHDAGKRLRVLLHQRAGEG